MTNEEKIILMNKLAENEAFLDAIAKVESKDELQQLFAENGLTLTDEEIDAFVKKVELETADELSEDALEDVAGGGKDAEWIFKTSFNLIKKVGKTAWNLGKKLANWEDNGYKKKKKK